jgi:hypothetical protein
MSARSATFGRAGRQHLLTLLQVAGAGRALGDDIMRVNATAWFIISFIARPLPEPEETP